MDSRVRRLLLLAAGCAVAFGALMVVAQWTDPGRSIESAAYNGFVSLGGWADTVSAKLVRLGDPVPVALMAVLLAAIGFASGRGRVAVLVLALIAVTSVSSQVLKAVFGHTVEVAVVGDVTGPDSFPSGHATAAMALALGAVLVVPRRAAAAVALVGGLLAFGVGASTVALGRHHPSDVLGGYLLSTTWTLALLAALTEANRRFPAGDARAAIGVGPAIERITARVLAAAGAAGLIVVIAGAAVLATDPSGPADFARAHPASIVVAAAVALAAVALPTAMSAVVRQA